MSSGQRRWTRSLIGGTPADDADPGYPGERLGLPREGSGAVAGWGRRIGAILIDWLICLWAIARGLLGADPVEAGWVAVGVLAVEYLVLVGTIGMTFGMRLMGIRVAALDGGRPRFPQVLVRTLLLCLAIPAVIFDRDRRGVHDRTSGTVVVRL